jgi:hypothetical protein
MSIPFDVWKALVYLSRVHHLKLFGCGEALASPRISFEYIFFFVEISHGSNDLIFIDASRDLAEVPAGMVLQLRV